MKTIMISLALLFFTGAKTFAQDALDPYEYYPDQNIYQDQDDYYWYYDDRAENWERTNALPTTYVIKPTSRKVKVYYKGTEVWRDNAKHKKQYSAVQRKEYSKKAKGKKVTKKTA